MLKLNIILASLFLSVPMAFPQNPTLPGNIAPSRITRSPGAIDILREDSGWYYYNGDHDQSNTNYIVGYSFGNYRNFFVFNLQNIGNLEVFDASLKIFAPGIGYRALNTRTYQVYIVESDLNELVNGTGGVDAYNGFVNGTQVASLEITPEMHSDRFVEIPLNASAVQAINNALAQGHKIAFAGDLPNPQIGDNFLFGYTGSGNDVYLSVKTRFPVPTLGEWGLASLILSLSIIGAITLRRQRKLVACEPN